MLTESCSLAKYPLNLTHKFDHVVELGYAGVVDGVQRGLVVVGDLQLDEAGQVVRRAERRYPVEHLSDVRSKGRISISLF